MRTLGARRFLLNSVVSVALVAFCVATSAQPPAPATDVNEFAGTWHWMFNGQPFATMILKPGAHGLTGSVGNASIDANQDGDHQGGGACGKLSDYQKFTGKRNVALSLQSRRRRD